MTLHGKYGAPYTSSQARRELLVAICQRADRTLNAKAAPTIETLTAALNEVLEDAIELHRREYGVAYYTELYEDEIDAPAAWDTEPMTGLLDRTIRGGKGGAMARAAYEIRRRGGTVEEVDLKASSDFLALDGIPGIEDPKTAIEQIERLHDEMEQRFSTRENEDDE